MPQLNLTDPCPVPLLLADAQALVAAQKLTPCVEYAITFDDPVNAETHVFRSRGLPDGRLDLHGRLDHFNGETYDAIFALDAGDVLRISDHRGNTYEVSESYVQGLGQNPVWNFWWGEPLVQRNSISNSNVRGTAPFPASAGDPKFQGNRFANADARFRDSVVLQVEGCIVEGTSIDTRSASGTSLRDMRLVRSTVNIDTPFQVDVRYLLGDGLQLNASDCGLNINTLNATDAILTIQGGGADPAEVVSITTTTVGPGAEVYISPVAGAPFTLTRSLIAWRVQPVIDLDTSVGTIDGLALTMLGNKLASNHVVTKSVTNPSDYDAATDAVLLNNPGDGYAGTVLLTDVTPVTTPVARVSPSGRPGRLLRLTPADAGSFTLTPASTATSPASDTIVSPSGLVVGSLGAVGSWVEVVDGLVGPGVWSVEASANYA